MGAMDHISNLLPNVSKEEITVLYLSLFGVGFLFQTGFGFFLILKKNKKTG